MVKLEAYREMELCFNWLDNGWEEWTVIEYCLQGVIKRFACCDKTSFDGKAFKLIFRERSILQYYEDCQAEIGKMTQHKIEDTSITYFDFLKMSMDVMTKYISHPQIIKNFESKVYKPCYPLYHEWLAIKFDEATAYKQATEEGDISGLKKFFQKLLANEYDQRIGRENLFFVIQLLAKYEAEINKSIFNEKELLCTFADNAIPEDEILEYYENHKAGKAHVKLDHYKECQAELTAMKKDISENDSTFNLLLKKPIDLLTRHITSGQYELKCTNEKIKKDYPIYSEWFDL